MPTHEQYEAAFEKERRNEYPVIDAFEQRMGYAVDRSRLEAAARVLACPVKKNPPNWQHGRVIYALARKYLTSTIAQQIWLDIGTAKGFSALCMAWALQDVDAVGVVATYDVLDPGAVSDRNSILGPGTLASFLGSFVSEDYRGIHLRVNTDIGEGRVSIVANHADDLRTSFDVQRIGFAFIDGSHTYEGVRADIATVTPRQQSGDIIMFDDIQVPGVAQAVSELEGYAIEYIDLLPKRKYAIAVKQ